MEEQAARGKYIFLFISPRKICKHVLLYACTSRTFYDIFKIIRMQRVCSAYVGGCQKCLTVQLATVSPAVGRGTSY